jgi:hypothetical protein
LDQIPGEEGKSEKGFETKIYPKGVAKRFNCTDFAISLA